MASSENRQKKLVDVLTLINESLTQADFVAAFKAVKDYIVRFEKKTSLDLQVMHSTLTALAEKVANDSRADLDSVKSETKKLLSSLSADINTTLDAQVAKVDQKLAEVKDGIDGRNGVDGVNGTDGKDGSPDSAEQIVEKINAGDALLDQEAVKGLPALEKKVEQIELRPSKIGGAKGIGLYVSGSKKLLTAQQINLIGGAGITLSYASANGRNDITITATGSASLTPIAMTGTIDDSNTSFTAASTPNIVIINGASYRHGKGVTISGAAVTTDSPVGTGGDIYGL